MKKSLLIILAVLSINLYGETVYRAAVKDLKMEELAGTYSTEKISNSLKGYRNKKEDLNEQAAKAVLVDLGALSVEELNSGKNIDEKLGNFVTDYINTQENYIGNVSDKNLIERLNNKWNKGKVIEDSSLNSALNKALQKGLTTGYNIKDRKEYANFDKNLTVSYGHSDMIHASQIIGLLKSEGIDAKVQLELKTSAFIYLPEWGKPGYTHTKMSDGTIIAHPLEYDLKLQFENKKDKEKFFELIDKYAKKDSEDEKGILYESWWQPFIQTEKTEGYEMLIDSIASDSKYDAHILTLPEKSKALVEELKKNKNIKVTTKEVWVNPAFYRFMLGEYK